MSPLRIAYILLIAAGIALRLAGASSPVSAADQFQVVNGAGTAGDVHIQPGEQMSESAPLATGRSVATPVSRANEAQRKPRKGLGAMGFARR